jgi:alpha-beta hydrolase superfamily lysophospholipase
LQYDSLNIKTSDGIRLTGWLCKPQTKRSNAVIIIASYDAGNMSDNIDLAQAIVENIGLRVILFDYRGFGSSDNFPIDTDFIALPEFTTDIHSVVEWTEKNIQQDTEQIILYGRSMGASLAITSTSLFGKIGGVIAESPYVSQSELSNKIKELYIQQHIDRPVKKALSAALEPLDLASRFRYPILLVHGQNERMISSDEVYKLYSTCGSSKKSLWIVSDCDHLQIPFKETSLFLTHIALFVQSLNSK